MSSSEEECQNPCDPNDNKECCVVYWHRMITKGYWNKDNHIWTDKGLEMIIKGKFNNEH